MKIYISGKITGIPIQEAETKFQAAQDLLESLDFEVVNPLKNGLKKDSSWKEHMVKDIDLILTCDVIYMIDGWTDSVGACLLYTSPRQTARASPCQSWPSYVTIDWAPEGAKMLCTAWGIRTPDLRLERAVS